MNKRAVILLFLMWQVLAGFSQARISGVVSDQSSGEPLPGVNVYIPEIQKGTFTDGKGKYFIGQLPRGHFKIQFSSIGYKTVVKEADFADADITMDVGLTPEIIHTQAVVISGGAYSTQHDNAVKIESVSRKRMDETGDIGVMKKLSSVPGVAVISKGTGITTPVIRGLSTSNILVLNNGIRMEDYQFSVNHPYLLNEFGIDRVEIIKGAASLLYGSDAVGGVLNFIREKPAPVGKVIGDLHTAYNVNTNGVSCNLGVKGTHKSFFWGMRAGGKTFEDYTDGNGNFVPNSRFNEASIKTFTGFNASFGVFRVDYEYMKMKPGLTVPPSIALVDTKGRKNEVWYQDLTGHQLSSKNTFFLNRWKLDANVSYQFNARKLMTNPQGPDFTDVDMRLQTLNWDVKGNYHISKGHSLILGVSGMVQQNRNRQAPEHVLPDYNLNDESLLTLYNGNINQRLFLQAGLRYDFRHIDVPEQEQFEDPLFRHYGNISGSVGGTYQLLKEVLLLRLNLASAFRTPGIAELTEDGQHGARYEVGDPNLKSQRNYETDVSLHYHSGIFLADVAGFYNHINNYIYLSPTADTTGEGLQIFRYVQNDADLSGFECSAELLPLAWLNLQAGYSFLRAEQTNGENLPLIPQNRLNGKITFSKTSKKWYRKVSFWLKAEYAFKQDRPAAFELETPAYWLMNAGADAKMQFGRQTVDLRFNLNNLFNETYLDHLSTLTGTGYYNIGRNFTVALRIPFG